MAWYYTDGTLYEGPTHVLLTNTFSGATRTSESRRLVEGEEPEVKPIRAAAGPKKK
jgi:hypothetical protein